MATLAQQSLGLPSADISTEKVFVVGVGMTKFEKPGRRENFDYPEMAKEAINKALTDARISYDKIQHAFVGYVYGDSTCGQYAIYNVGMTGIPVFNVNNNCSTGSTALYMGAQFIAGGLSDCVLAVGFEKMSRGSLSSVFSDRANPMEKHISVLAEVSGIVNAPIAAQLFGNAGIEHMKKYGTTEEHLAKIALKNHRHSVNNPNSQFQDEYSLDQILNSPKIFGPLTKLQCCPTSDGSAAVVLASEAFVVKHSLQNFAVEILGIEMATDFSSTFSEMDPMKLVGYDMTCVAAQRLFTKTGISPVEVDVVELHDCFSANELITYEALGLCGIGEAGKFIDSGDNTYGGRCVVNPSGGLISKGHPLGATGLAQCTELCWQLRGTAGNRQVPDAKIGLQHNIGLGGAVVVALYKLGFKSSNKRSSTKESDLNGITYDHSFKSGKFFDLITTFLRKEAANVQFRVLRFNIIEGPNGTQTNWLFDARNNFGPVTEADVANVDVTVTINDDDFHDFMTGNLSYEMAFIEGKLKIDGNEDIAEILLQLQKEAKALVAKL